MHVDKKHLWRSERTPRWQQLMVLLVGVCLLTSMGRYFAGNLGGLLTTMALLPCACAFAGIVLLCTEVRGQPAFLLLLALLALVFVSSAYSEKAYGVFTENRDYIGVLVASIFVFFPLGFALPDEKRLPVLHGLIGMCAAIVTVVCLWGLILAASGAYFVPRFQPEYGIGLCPPAVGMGADFRLVTFTHPNTVGMVCEIIFLLSLYRVLTAKRAAVRALYIVSAVVCFAAIGAASSRTSSLAACVGLAMLVFRYAYMRLSHKGVALRWGIALASAAIAAVVGFVVLNALYDVLLSLSPAGRSELAALTDAERVIADESSAFSGRTSIWSGVLRCMQDTPRLFVVGASPVQVGHVIASYSPIWVQEVHSSFVQMLISCGALCPALFFAFVVLVAVRGARQFLRVPKPGEADAGWIVPVLVAVLISACMETFLLLYPQLHFANLWFFLLAGYVMSARGQRVGER